MCIRRVCVYTADINGALVCAIPLTDGRTGPQQVGTVIYLSHVRRDETSPWEDHSGPEAATVAGQVALKGPTNNPPPPHPLPAAEDKKARAFNSS